MQMTIPNPAAGLAVPDKSSIALQNFCYKAHGERQESQES
jgi:hypothetical protein